MALSDVIVAFNVHDWFGGDFDIAGSKAWATNSADDQKVDDTSTGESRIGSAFATVATDGTGTFTHWAPGADGNPISWQNSYHFRIRDKNAPDGFRIKTFGPFTVTGTSKTVTNKALTTNVATLTTSTAHGLVVGNTITVAITDAVFDGTHAVTAVPSAMTISYAKTNANVTSAAATGTLTSPNVLLTSLEQEQAVPATYLSTVTALLDSKVTAAQLAETNAETAQAGAQAAEAAANAAILADLGTSDGQLTAIDGNAASAFRVQSDLRHSATQARLGEFDEPTAFLMATFSGIEDLTVWTSEDGKDFAANPNNPVYNPATGGVRDPAIIYHRGAFYAAITTATSAVPEGTSFDIITSTNPAEAGTWTSIATIDCTAATVAAAGTSPYTWAPSLYVDDDGTVYAFVSINQQEIWVTHATDDDLTAWSTPQPVVFTGSVGTVTYLDADIVKIGSTYHMHFKANNYGRFSHATSSIVTGPYVDHGFLTWPSFVPPTGNGYEGPCVIRVGPSRWRLYADVTDDLSGMAWTENTNPSLDKDSWGPLTTCTIGGAPNGYALRHGTVIGLGSTKEAARALALPDTAAQEAAAQAAATAIGMRVAQAMTTGGGTVSVTSDDKIAWSARFLVLGAGGGAQFATGGYFDITMPPDATVIPGVGAASDATVTSGRITLPGFHVLYYVVPVGSGTASVAANFRVASYGALDVPANWLMIAHHNGDDHQFRFVNGISLTRSQQWTASGGVVAYP